MRRVPFLMPTGRKLLCNVAMPLALLMLALMACPFSASAQSSGLEDGPPPPYDAPAPDATPAASATASVTKPSEPVWDPLHASKSIEVGMYYKKKGNYDAAIERFEDAARLQPGLARPFYCWARSTRKSMILPAQSLRTANTSIFTTPRLTGKTC